MEVLKSSQLTFTGQNALEDLQEAPSHQYTIIVFLRAREGSTFRNVAYTEQIKHFMGTCLAGDKEFIILKARRAARINAITCQAEIPTNTLEFEEDFARDVQVDTQYRWIRFRISVASSLSFTDLFRNDNFHTSKLIKRFNWFVDKYELEHKCHMVHIGWFKYLNPAIVNRDDIREDFDQYFCTILTEYDFTSKIERRVYKTLTADGEEKSESCHIRVLSIYVPVDIAARASEVITELWDNELKEEKKIPVPLGTMPNRLLSSVFIPNSKKLLAVEDQIQHLLAQGLFIQQHQDPIFIYNCTNLHGQFKWSDEMADIANVPALAGKSISIHEILASWLNMDTNERVVLGIEQMNRQRFAVMVSETNKSHVKKTLNEVVTILRSELGDDFDCIGGQAGGMRVEDQDGLCQTNKSKSYLKSLQHKRHYVKSEQRQIQPSSIATSCISTDVNNSKLTHLYSDVIQSTNPPTTIATKSATTSTTSLTLSQNNGSNTQLSTLDDFNKLVQQKVDSMLAPTLSQLSDTIATVQQSTMESTN